MKERLTGAIILVALIVVLVPELLSGPIRPAAHARGPVPSAEEPPLRSITIDLAGEAHEGSGEMPPQPSGPPTPVAPAAEPAAAPQAAASQPVASSQPGAPDAASVAADQGPPSKIPAAAASAVPHPTAPAAPAAAGSTSNGWVVQLGSFASRANADRLAQKVHALGYPVLVSRGTSGKRLYRVQVGPAHDRAAGEQILSKLRAQGYKGPLVPK